MKARLWKWIAIVVLGCSSVCAFAQSCGETVPQVRKDYFAKIGIGADYGPHYPCYNKTDGSVYPCFNNDGTPTTSAVINDAAHPAMQDAKDSEMETSVPLDLTQLRLGGFSSVRAYGDPAKVWIAMINQMYTLNQTYGEHHAVVYQVAGCQSDPTTHRCKDGTLFQDILDFSKVQLKQVIQEVSAKKFQSVVKLIIVTNEDLQISGGTSNVGDLTSAITQTEQVLTDNGVAYGPGGVDISSSMRFGEMQTTYGQTLAAAFPAGSPVIENIYGAMDPSVPDPAQAVIPYLQHEIVTLQALYPNRPVLIGETGWWTQGADAGYGAPNRVGTLADAKSYYQALYSYIKSCSVPTLIFEAYDEAGKAPAGTPIPPSGEAEQNYGVFYYNNKVKDKALLPGPLPGYKDYDTSQATLFVFSGNEPIPTETNQVIGVQNPGDTQPTKITSRVFRQCNNTNCTSTTEEWPFVNAYAGSQVFLYQSVSGPAKCSNTVASIYNTVQRANATVYVPPFSGGVWTAKGPSAVPQCPGVNWQYGSTDQSGNPTPAQNVFVGDFFKPLK